MTRLILIRHGETDYHLENKYCGFSNPSLNKKGIWQSKMLSDRLTNIKVERVYSSDLKRAAETAKIIFNPSTTLRINGERPFDRLRVVPSEVEGRSRTIKKNSIEQLPDFREMNFGIFEGLKYDEIVKKYQSLYKNWINNPIKVKIPDGESLQDLVKRVRKRLTSILSQYKDGKIALVTHGGPIRVILCDALKFDLDSFWKIKQDIAALNIIDYPEGSSPIVVKMNDIFHLTMQEEVTA